MAEERGSFENDSVMKFDSQTTDPFRATRLWQQIIKHIQVYASVGRQRYLLKYYDNVFNGTNLVDVVFAFLHQQPSDLIVQDVTRSKAVKVCQVLMDNNLFESVLPRSYSKFEDSSSRLYRFLEERVSSLPINSLGEKYNKENQRILCSSFMNPAASYPESNQTGNLDVNMGSETKHTRKPLQESTLSFIKHSPHDRCRKQCGNMTPMQSGFDQNSGKIFCEPQIKTSDFQRKNSLFVHGSIRKSLTRLRNKKTSAIQLTGQQSKVIDDLPEDTLSSLQQLALACLLSIVDIPILESILSVPSNLSKVTPSVNELIIQNAAVGSSRRIDTYSRLCADMSRIPWVQAATLCISKPPDGVGHLWSVQACKIHCYKSVADYYSNVSTTILPESFVSIYTAVIDLIKQNRHKKAQYALQLLMVVLPWQRRTQLCNLLHFLEMVIEDIFVNVDKQVSNHEAVVKDFLDVVFNHPLVSKNYCQILFDFLIYRVSYIFQIPSSLKDSTNHDLMFCQQVLDEDFGKMSAHTSASLKQLAFSVMDSTTMQLKRKRTWLKKFKKCHPELYSTCIPETN